MLRNRDVSLSMLSAAATLWALLMGLGGTWLLIGGGPRWGLPPVAALWSGLFWLAAGELLFMCLVADRWFPDAARRIAWPLEIGASLVLIGGGLAFAFTLLGAWM